MSSNKVLTKRKRSSQIKKQSKKSRSKKNKNSNNTKQQEPTRSDEQQLNSWQSKCISIAKQFANEIEMIELRSRPRNSQTKKSNIGEYLKSIATQLSKGKINSVSAFIQQFLQSLEYSIDQALMFFGSRIDQTKLQTLSNKGKQYCSELTSQYEGANEWDGKKAPVITILPSQQTKPKPKSKIIPITINTKKVTRKIKKK